MIVKIVSGGQTGADRGGLNAGISLGIEIGGWAPKGYEAEDDRVPPFYGLKECPAPGYFARTEQNVIDSNMTAIFYYEKLSGGSRSTKKFCLRNNRPYIAIDCLKPDDHNIKRLTKWLESHGSVLNVAGIRSSKSEKWRRSIGHDTHRILCAAIRFLRQDKI